MGVGRLRGIGLGLLAAACAGVIATTANEVAHAAEGDVVVSEIMFDPPSDLDIDEFLEIWNSGPSALNISGWCLTGVTFCFPAGSSIAAGQFLLVSPDAARTQATYGRATAGTYTGSLRNSGEVIAIKNAANVDIHSFSYLDIHPWPVLPDGQGSSLELISLNGPRNSPWNWAASQAPSGATPGAVNSVNRPGVPQSINSVTESNRRPAVGEVVTVTADISGQVGIPQIQYRTNMGPFATSPMVSAGGNLWTFALPAQQAGTMLEYKIDTQGVFPHSYPRIDDSWRTIGIWYARPLVADIPVFEWFISEADWVSMTTTYRFDTTDFTFESAMVMDNEVITGARVRVRGDFSRNDPKFSFKWELPQNHDLITNGRLVEPVDEFAMQADYSDRTYGRSMLSFGVYASAGVARPQRFPMRVERNGQFQGLYGFMETYDKNWRERNGYEDEGALFDADSSVWNLTRSLDSRWDQKSGPENGLSIVNELSNNVVQLTGAQREAYARANFDIPQLINWAALTAINSNIDAHTHNFYAFKANVDGRWRIIPWDLDHTWGNSCSCGVVSSFVFPAEPGDRVNEMIEAVLEVPEFKEMYFRRLRTLSDQLFAPGVLIGMYDQGLAGAQATIALDKQLWARTGTAASDRNSVNFYIEQRRQTIYADARLPGAQAAAPGLVISEVYTSPIAGGAQFVELHNPSASAIDISGWQLQGAVTATLQPGTVIAAGRSIVVVSDDLAFRFALGGQALVAGRFGGALPTVGTLNVTRADGSVADTVSYGGAGFVTPAAGQSLQVINLANSNDAAANWRAATPTPGSTQAVVATYTCTKSVVGNDAVLSFSGPRGSSWEQLRRNGNWAATVTGLANYTVVNGANDTYTVRVRGTGFASPYQTFACN